MLENRRAGALRNVVRSSCFASGLISLNLQKTGYLLKFVYFVKIMSIGKFVLFIISCMIFVVCSDCFAKRSHFFGVLVFAEKLPVIKCLTSFFVQRIKIPMLSFFFGFVKFRGMMQSIFIFIVNFIFPVFFCFYVPGFCNIFIVSVFIFKPVFPIILITFIAD